MMLFVSVFPLSTWDQHWQSLELPSHSSRNFSLITWTRNPLQSTSFLHWENFLATMEFPEVMGAPQPPDTTPPVFSVFEQRPTCRI